RPSRTSTSGRARVGMKFCTNVLYVSLIIRCDSAAIVSKTSELLPEPHPRVNTVSRRLGSSTLMSLRLFSRAPWTRIRSWLSATCDDEDVAVREAVVMGGHRVPADRERWPAVHVGRLSHSSATPGRMHDPRLTTMSWPSATTPHKPVVT